MYKILIVEDDTTIREAFSIILSMSGNDYDVTTAENGQVAIDLCQSSSYDLILLDIMMPILDGVGFLKKYTIECTDSAAKVVVMSNLSSGSELSIVQDYGVSQTVLKSSLSPTKLIETVETVRRRPYSPEQAIDAIA